jgi:tRNA U34 5-methylaminomethyl-2-thiouridine-forming methyltransferase MnmC
MMILNKKKLLFETFIRILPYMVAIVNLCMNKIVKTDDNSNSLYSEYFKEHYHSIHGAINESNHIFIQSGLLYSNLKTINVFEVGFGTGLNAFLSFIEGKNQDIHINYCSIEKFPISIEIAQELNFAKMISTAHQDIFMELHNSDWNEEIEIDKSFTFKKIHSDFNDYHFIEKYDIIYFDAFSPETQPELWSKEVFDKIYNSLNTNGILTTYSSKGIVKNNLRDVGFTVKRLKGPIGKRHILRATKV